MANITMPRFSDSMIEGTVVDWLKDDGDLVAKGEHLVEIETDKATMTYDSPVEGALAILVKTGETVPVGALIATIGAADAVPDQDVSVVEAASAAASDSGQEAAGDGEATAVITAVARRLAQSYGVDLSTVKGTGRRGRVLRRDIEGAAGIQSAVVGGPPAHAADVGLARFDDHELQTRVTAVSNPSEAGREATTVELTRIQQVIARRMSEAKSVVPDFQVQVEVEMDAALQMRTQLKAIAGQDAPSLNDLIVKAAALALRDCPRANGSFVNGHFELHSEVNVGIAVATADALLVPTITGADARSLGSIANESRRLAQLARSGEITPPDMAGGTFTISNLGMYGVTAVSPVINPPQAAILGVGAVRILPALVDGQLAERHVLTLNLNCDHRILYGAEAAQFLGNIRYLLEQPMRLAL